jgi:hypothetical protein
MAARVEEAAAGLAHFGPLSKYLSAELGHKRKGGGFQKRTA